MNKKLYIIIAGIVMLILFVSVKSKAETQDIVELREQREILKEKISENTLQVEELKGQISDLMIQLQDLSDRIYKYEVNVAVLNKEMEELNKRIEVVEKQFDEIEKTYNERKELLANRIVAQYEAGDVVYLDFLLSSKSLIELISNYYMISDIIEYDNELIRTCEIQREEIGKIKQELDNYKEELKEKRHEQEKSAVVLSNIRVLKRSQMNELSEQERNLQNQIDEYQEETQKIEVELLMILTQNLGSEYVGGELCWPAPGYTTITYKYGMRIHPISNIFKMHMGIDIAAPTGSYAVSANDGIVVKSEYNASYGNMVVVDHGGGLSTIYAHGEERLVETGDTVTRGQPVLKVGSTGVSTGPHLHFEVRVNGGWTNPLDYLLNRSNIRSNEEEQVNE